MIGTGLEHSTLSYQERRLALVELTPGSYEHRPLNNDLPLPESRDSE